MIRTLFQHLTQCDFTSLAAINHPGQFPGGQSELKEPILAVNTTLEPKSRNLRVENFEIFNGALRLAV
jgi:hypothetical protein